MGPKFSILVCAYSNGYQFNNFLWTAINQNFPDPFYEIIVIDNATPTMEIRDACREVPYRRVKYRRIGIDEKKCRNITQGLNKAGQMAKGDYVVIVADSNLLLGYSLLSEIDSMVDRWKMVISGKGTD